MKKIHLEVFPSNTNKKFKPRFYDVGLVRIAFVILFVAFAVLGFLFFDFSAIQENIFSPKLSTVKANNNKLERTYETTKTEIERIKKNLLAINKISLKVTALAGRDSLVELISSGKFDTLSLPKLHYKIFAFKSYFRTIDSLFEKDPSVAASLPVIHPLKRNFFVSNLFANILDPFTGKRMPHMGIDYVAQNEDPVIATGAGTVEKVEETMFFGKTVLILHSNNVYSYYAHLSKVNVGTGKAVKRGETIGLIGNTGRSSGPHLHYEIRIGEKQVNPLNYILSAIP